MGPQALRKGRFDTDKTQGSDGRLSIGMVSPSVLNYDLAVVTAKGARRWQNGNPWIYRSDLSRRPIAPAGAVRVEDHRGKPIGVALWSPASEISLRMVDHHPNAELDDAWWRKRTGAAIERRRPLTSVANAYRLIHGEADACPSLI